MLTRRPLWLPIILAWLMLVPAAHAVPICFHLVGLIDILRLDVDPRPTLNHYGIPEAQQTAATLYRLQGVGSAGPSHPALNQLSLAIYFGNPGIFFGGNAACAFNAELNIQTAIGTWRIVCSGGPNPFTVPPVGQPPAPIEPISCVDGSAVAMNLASPTAAFGRDVETARLSQALIDAGITTCAGSAVWGECTE